MSENQPFQTEPSSALHALLPALQRLDGLLARAVAVAQIVYDKPSATDRFRGLYINEAQVAQAMMRSPATPLFAVDANNVPISTAPAEQRATWRFWRDWRQAKQSPYSPEQPPISKPTPPSVSELPRLTDSPPFQQLKSEFQLKDFELDMILITLGGMLDNRYGLLYAYLQDNVAMRQPTVELILNIVCANSAEKLSNRAAFYVDAPLIKEQLITLHEGNARGSGLLTQTAVLDEQIVRFMLGTQALDTQLAAFCTILDAVDNVMEASDDRVAQLELDAKTMMGNTPPPLLYLECHPTIGKRTVANTIANAIEQPSLLIDCQKLNNVGLDFATIKRIEREIWLLDLVPIFVDVDHLADAPLFGPLCERVAAVAETAVFIGTSPWRMVQERSLPVITVPIRAPNYAQRQHIWEEILAQSNLAYSEETATEMASLYRLSSEQIQQAVTLAEQQLQWQEHGFINEERDVVHRRVLKTAVHAQFNHTLGNLAQKIDPLYTWHDIVLPPDAMQQLRQICIRVQNYHRVWGAWEFDKRLSQGKGINVLFAGSSGTGKTMAAEIIANELGYELYKIDLSGVVSKYIGETEKNLNQIFKAAESASAILFFDEADSLFGKRSEVRDAHDRYANIEISYLLQKMEMFEGVSILATNLKQHLDEAFIRRITDTIHFPFPDSGSRAEIWRTIWPSAAPVSADIDFDQLAEAYQLSGGAIKNAALTAAFLAAADNSTITLDHLYRAIQQEYNKMGHPIIMPNQEVAL